MINRRVSLQQGPDGGGYALSVQAASGKEFRTTALRKTACAGIKRKDFCGTFSSQRQRRRILAKTAVPYALLHKDCRPLTAHQRLKVVFVNRFKKTQVVKIGLYVTFAEQPRGGLGRGVQAAGERDKDAAFGRLPGRRPAGKTGKHTPAQF